MSQLTFILSALLLVIAVIIGLTIHNRLKLRQQVQRNWGKQPHQTRLDKEESLKKAWQIEKNFHQWESEIDDITWYDLDLYMIFDLINATYSSVGSEALYQRLRNFDFQQDDLESIITFYKEQPKVREEIQYLFAQLGKQDNNFTKQYLADGNHKKMGQPWLYLSLGFLPIASLLLALFQPFLGIMLLIGSVLFNTCFYLVKKNQLDTELNSMRYLVQTIATAEKLSKLKGPWQSELQTLVRPLKAIAHWGFSFRSKEASEADLLFDYLNMIFMIPFIAYNVVISRISSHSDKAIKLWNLLGKLEVAAAILNFRTFMPLTCQPQFKEGGVSAENSYHPLINGAVANPVNWQKNTLVTGSNASGKSTYVKSIALNCILAQTINTAIAESFTLQRGHVLTSMAVEDDLFEGDSYFVAEIKSIKRLLSQVEKGTRCYCFVDEILKGTNTVERIAASSSVVSWLDKYPSLAFVATHDIELTEILKNKCENLHFEEQVTEESGIAFDYLLKYGPATSRNAINLLKVLHYPTSLVSQAMEEAHYFDDHRTWQIIE
ncbi:MutS-related protein [Enterococcus songbeiensis]|uniref:MutS-related protein n=1 Tax=Enterococcus songbeiensis TaxID=2559927 RepID=UPI0010F62ABC|nr:DNA mismatch repair protein MutS [Enterococcus songbeiensis]